MFAEELAAWFALYARTGLPRMPDQPQGGVSPRGPNWTLNLTQREAARMCRAIELGARGSFWWTEKDRS